MLSSVGEGDCPTRTRCPDGEGELCREVNEGSRVKMSLWRRISEKRFVKKIVMLEYRICKKAPDVLRFGESLPDLTPGGKNAKNAPGG
jgi:hypothetical protein